MGMRITPSMVTIAKTITATMRTNSRREGGRGGEVGDMGVGGRE